MTEVYVLIERQRSVMTRIFAYIALGLCIGTFLISLVVPLFLTAGIILAIVWYFLQFRSFKEYEYSFFDGDVKFAKIMNKSRRKRLKTLTMDEVVMIAPAGDRGLYKYENDHNVKKIDYTSGKRDIPYYQMVTKHENEMSIISFEPDEKYLDAVCVKYSQKVVRNK